MASVSTVLSPHRISNFVVSELFITSGKHQDQEKHEKRFSTLGR